MKFVYMILVVLLFIIGCDCESKSEYVGNFVSMTLCETAFLEESKAEIVTDRGSMIVLASRCPRFIAAGDSVFLRWNQVYVRKAEQGGRLFQKGVQNEPSTKTTEIP